MKGIANDEHEKKESGGTEVRKTPLGIEKKFDKFGDWLDDSWAVRKATPWLNRYPKSITIFTWLIRIAIGGIFIVSGLSKGIDPWGSYYKMVEYLTAMHIPVNELGNAVLALVFSLFTVEFIIGISLVFGCYRKAAPITGALFMLVMLPLTLWIAITDPVADCGCFGDFIAISNWSTFIKNCLISIGIVWLLKFNTKTRCLISPSIQWMATVVAAAYIVIVGYIGYWQQPTIDFRQYKIGTRLLAADDEPEYDMRYEFVYEKDGEYRIVDEDDELPDESEGWKFVRRDEKEFVSNEHADSVSSSEASDFRIWSENGEEDVTDLLSGYDRQMILLVPDISELSMATSWKINKLYDMSKASDSEFFAVVAGSAKEIEEWRDLSSGQYPIYTADDTSIKELARGNPALVGLEKGRIIWKSSLSALRLNDDDIDDTEISASPVGMTMTGQQALIYLSLLLLSFLAILCIFSSIRYWYGKKGSH
ncbi:MAG: DoxX family protein [Muribaculaceae bacterium]|nr:DoxX family protein [Muribaculaceae bacterium]